MMSNCVLYVSQANYKFIIKIPMELIQNICFICIHYMIIYISFVNIMVYLLHWYCNMFI